MPASRDIRKHDNFLKALKPGVLVAVHISNYKKTPTIGKLEKFMTQISHWTTGKGPTVPIGNHTC